MENDIHVLCVRGKTQLLYLCGNAFISRFHYTGQNVFHPFTAVTSQSEGTKVYTECIHNTARNNNYVKTYTIHYR